MSAEDEGFSIEADGRDIVLTVWGHFTEYAAVKSTDAFEKMLGTMPVRFIVDFGRMKSYDRGARTLWGKVLRPLRDRISVIYFCGEAPALVKMAASAVALAAGIRMRFLADKSLVPSVRETLADED